MSIKQNKYLKHSYFMKLALLQAQKNLGNTGKNPAVGCVIVKRDCVISVGCTGLNGRPHAEQNAISRSKNNISNSDLYVTLEPCSHYGYTPPCVKAIIKNKIKKVFFSLKDPDPRSHNKSTKQFKKNKINVQNGILSTDIKNFYKSYFKYKKKFLPFVTAKMAISKDFYSNNKKKKWITNKFSRGRVHLMRNGHDCVLTSVNTIIIDNPRLTCRIRGLENYSPTRIILDKQLRIPISSSIVKSSHKYRTIIFFNKINQKKIRSLKNLKIKLVKICLSKDGNFDLENILVKIRLLGFSRVFLESGLNLTTNFLNKDLVDDFKLFISSKKLGSNGNNSFKQNMKLFLNGKKFSNEKTNLFGDRLITYKLK